MTGWGELDKRPRAGGRAVLSRSARKMGGRRDGENAWTRNSHAGCSKVWSLPSNSNPWVGVTEEGR